MHLSWASLSQHHLICHLACSQFLKRLSLHFNLNIFAINLYLRTVTFSFDFYNSPVEKTEQVLLSISLIRKMNLKRDQVTCLKSHNWFEASFASLFTQVANVNVCISSLLHLYTVFLFLKIKAGLQSIILLQLRILYTFSQDTNLSWDWKELGSETTSFKSIEDGVLLQIKLARSAVR